MERAIKKRLAVLVSGAGTNLQAILDAAAGPSYPAEVVLVMSDRDGVAALDRSAAAGVESVVVRLEDHADRDAFTRACVSALEKHAVELVVTAGYMKLFAPSMFERFPRILNVHPSLLPAFPGYAKKVLRDTLAYGVKVTGVTIHFLEDGTDTGPVVFQEAVAVEDGDSPESLHARLQVVEHRLLPDAVRLMAEEKLTLDGRRVRIQSGT